MVGIAEYIHARNSKGKWKEPIPEAIVDMLHRTRRLYLTWWTMHYGVGLIGLVAGTLLTAISSFSLNEASNNGDILLCLQQYSWLIGIVATVSTSLVTFLGPLHKAERYYSAYHALEQACLEYLDDGSSPKLKVLFDDVFAVRRKLQSTEITPKKSQT